MAREEITLTDSWQLMPGNQATLRQPGIVFHNDNDDVDADDTKLYIRSTSSNDFRVIIQNDPDKNLYLKTSTELSGNISVFVE